MTTPRRAALSIGLLLPFALGAQRARTETAVLAGGCFWGIEYLFEHVKGVTSAVSGYAGGDAKSANYGAVSNGLTGHAESVRIVFDPAVVSFTTILEVFFSVGHDPTQLDRQGPDVGPQYRSAIFFANAEQKKAADDMIAKLTAAKSYRRPIVTQVTPLAAFYEAEDYHQDYAFRHPDDRYIMFNDLPKVDHLRAKYPALYRDSPAKR